MVSISGPYLPGDHQDLTIFRNHLKCQLNVSECVIAGRGYPDECCITPNNVSQSMKRFNERVRGRHEKVNRYFKSFAILSTPFKYKLNTHGVVFHAIGKIVQYMLQNDQPIFQV